MHRPLQLHSVNWPHICCKAGGPRGCRPRQRRCRRRRRQRQAARRAAVAGRHQAGRADAAVHLAARLLRLAGCGEGAAWRGSRRAGAGPDGWVRPPGRRDMTWKRVRVNQQASTPGKRQLVADSSGSQAAGRWCRRPQPSSSRGARLSPLPVRRQGGLQQNLARTSWHVVVGEHPAAAELNGDNKCKHGVEGGRGCIASAAIPHFRGNCRAIVTAGT